MFDKCCFLVVSHMLELPRSVLFKLGDRTELKCSMLSCPEKVKFVWTTLEDKPIFATPKTEDKETVLIFDNVMKNHANTILCKATCGKETKQAKVEVKVYCECILCFQFNHSSRIQNTLVSCHFLPQ